MLLFFKKNDKLWFSVLTSLLLMPNPGFSLSCIKCDGVDCDKPDASKGTPCTDEKSCLIYGAPGSIIRGCANETQKKCVKELIGEKSCYSVVDGPPDKKAKIEACLKKGPGDGTLGTDKKICYCEKDNCNKATASSFAEGNGEFGRPWYLGTLMRRIKCYECEGKPGSACADGNVKKMKDLTTACNGVCNKRVRPKSVKRTCYRFTNEIFECLKNIAGLCHKASEDEESRAKEKAEEHSLMSRLNSCFANHGIDYDYRKHADLADPDLQDIKEECYCASDLCNSVGHSSPNNLIFGVSLMATFFKL